jgi:hypothetical protein
MDVQTSNDELYPIAVLIDELKVGNPWDDNGGLFVKMYRRHLKLM